MQNFYKNQQKLRSLPPQKNIVLHRCFAVLTSAPSWNLVEAYLQNDITIKILRGDRLFHLRQNSFQVVLLFTKSLQADFG